MIKLPKNVKFVVQEVKCKPKKQKKCCEEIDDTKYICLDQLETRSLKRDVVIKNIITIIVKKNLQFITIIIMQSPRMSSHLYFPLYPIHGPFVTHRVAEHHHRDRKCKNHCDDDC